MDDAKKLDTIRNMLLEEYMANKKDLHKFYDSLAEMLTGTEKQNTR